MAARSKFNRLKGTICTLFLFLALPVMSFSQTVGIFFNSAVPQDSFAAYDVRDALVAKGLSPVMEPLSSLTEGYANRKVVIAQLSNAEAKRIATAQGVTGLPTTLGEQAYVLKSVTTPAQSHWIFGGDAVGSMYGGFQITENIMFTGFAGTYDKSEAPHVKERGIKLNIPYDKRSGTYNYDAVISSSIYQSIKNVWDLSFWKEWLDVQARNRYNMLSLWSNCPFTSMVSLPDYPLAALVDVQDSAGTVIKRMTIDQKIQFWKDVMQYAHNRGFKFYLFNWNVYTGGATAAGKYPTLLKDGDCTHAGTMTYLYKSLYKALETYPNLDGFGCTGGESMGSNASNNQKANFLWNAYGKAMYDFARLPANSSRTLTFIERMHQVSIDIVMGMQGFQDLKALPNIRFRASYKYARCTMYSVARPTHWESEGVVPNLNQWSLRTYLTIRNDDLFFCQWGDPSFARVFINQLPSLTSYIDGFYIGSDGFTPTRVFHAKAPLNFYQNKLEIQRLWYREMIWGRLSYNPTTSDDVFKGYIAQKFPTVDNNALFTAWIKASKAFQVGNEFIRDAFLNDYMYYPEGQVESSQYITMANFAAAAPVGGSTLTNYVVVADSVKRLANAALATLNSINTAGNPELAVTIKNIQMMACLGHFVGEKIRAGELVAAGNKPAAKPVYELAWCAWKTYIELMDAMHVGQSFTRTKDLLPDWGTALNNFVLSDYKIIAGATAVPPACTPLTTVGIKPVGSIVKKQPIGVRALSTSSITLDLPGTQGFSLEIFASNGAKVAELGNSKNTAGVSRFVLGKKLAEGVYMVRLNSAGYTNVQQMNVCCD